MLIKEYRIGLPMTVEEYRIAQLYMIQKKSRDESSGSGSGVEIKINEPYKDGPGGDGQYTHKIYHIGSHLPGWFRAILPKSALRVEEEAWNAYPYTRTIYTCPFVEKFSLEIETRYLNDGGQVDNIFNLPTSELRTRVVDYLDIVKDTISSSDYRKEEDPKLFVSATTGRGPLTEAWWEDYSAATAAHDPHRAMMTAYKLCKVEFKYWGMQSRIERFIHDIGLRKTMLRAHRQAWCWQDEYNGLTMDDIRRLELETQLALQEKMAAEALEQELTEQSGKQGRRFSRRKSGSPKKDSPPKTLKKISSSDSVSTVSSQRTITEESAGGEGAPPEAYNVRAEANNVRAGTQMGRVQSKGSLLSGSSSGRRQSWTSCRSKLSESSSKLAEWRVESIEQLQTSSDDDEFYDAIDMLEDDRPRPVLYKSSSIELATVDDMNYDHTNHDSGKQEASMSPLESRMQLIKNLQTGATVSVEGGVPPLSPTLTGGDRQACKATILFLVVHGGTIMDTGQDYQVSKHSDITTLRTTLDTVLQAHYPAMKGRVAVRMVSCTNLCAQTLSLLASISPYSFDAQSPTVDSAVVANENFPLAAIPLFSTNGREYGDAVWQALFKMNHVYGEFVQSEEGQGFNGQVCVMADSIGSIMAYDVLCKQSAPAPPSTPGIQEDSASEDDHGQSEPVFRHSNPDLTVTDTSSAETMIVDGTPTRANERPECGRPVGRQASCPPPGRRTSTGSHGDSSRLHFDVCDFFMLGSPIGLILAYRRTCQREDRGGVLLRPACHQLYNLFYPSDPSAVRLEPLIQERFKLISPIKIPRYQRFPLGDGQSVHVVETIQSNSEMFMESPAPVGHHPEGSALLERRQSNWSMASQVSGQGELTAANIAALTSKWWGTKRLDYALYNPEALQSFPGIALPYLLHASCWESTDIAAFILRQVLRQDTVSQADLHKDGQTFRTTKPREKWLKRRTTIKLRNVGPNHRANDIIVLEDLPQTITARFMYGPLDMVSLSGEKVDVHIMSTTSSGEWDYLDTVVTDSSGRATYALTDKKRVNQGMYPVKMVVRGDHTSVDLFLTVLPPQTETVVFSIDGSFTASVSIMGKDPKVRPGAVDVVRHWQELGYLILYMTARPDMQQRKVIAWLAQHNFPHGMTAFMDGLSAEPLKQKAAYLNRLVNEAKIQIHAVYGSSKDISVYNAVGVPYANMYIVGKVSKKYKEVNYISGGYASHLAQLASHGGSRPASGNARMFLRKGCFCLPGQTKPSGKRPVRKTLSLPQRHSSMREGSEASKIAVSGTGNTVVEPGMNATGPATRPRGVSPRGKVAVSRYDSTSA